MLIKNPSPLSPSPSISTMVKNQSPLSRSFSISRTLSSVVKPSPLSRSFSITRTISSVVKPSPLSLSRSIKNPSLSGSTSFVVVKNPSPMQFRLSPLIGDATKGRSLVGPKASNTSSPSTDQGIYNPDFWRWLGEKMFTNILHVIASPVTVGDFIVLSGEIEGVIKDVGILVTTIETAGQHEIVVPNKTFVSDNYIISSGGSLPVLLKFVVPCYESMDLEKKIADVMKDVPYILEGSIQTNKKSLNFKDQTVQMVFYCSVKATNIQCYNFLKDDIVSKLLGIVIGTI